MRSVTKASVWSSTRPVLWASGQSSGWAVAFEDICSCSAVADGGRMFARRPTTSAAGHNPPLAGNLHLDVGGFQTFRKFCRRRCVGDQQVDVIELAGDDQ